MATEELIRHIDFCLYFKGHTNAQELAQRFLVGTESAIQALSTYSLNYPNAATYDANSETLLQTETFTPKYQHNVQSALVKLSNQLITGFKNNANEHSFLPPTTLNIPQADVVANLTKAIVNGNCVNIIYTSLSSGSNSRDIVPHSIVDNGFRWHVRAFDRKSRTFRDFVLTRISRVSIRSSDIYEHETKAVDWSWQQPIELKIKPHPNNVQFPTAIEMDYSMENGELQLSTNAALVGYLLRRWNIDCSKKATLLEPQYQLWLANNDVLNDIENAQIAPGFLN